MTFNEIFEEHSVKEISKTTNISEENIEKLKAEDFSQLVKAKALGFISILERDYHVDLKPIRQKALTYYEKNLSSEDSVNIALPRADEKQGRSKLFPLIVLGLLAYASWYFITQFDKKTLATMLPFGDDKTEELLSANVLNSEDKSLSISSALKATEVNTPKNKIVAKIEPKKIIPKKVTPTKSMPTTTSVSRNAHTLLRDKKIILLPAKKIWFGIIDMETGKRDHFSISKRYKIDVTKKRWLVATSKATFAFINGSRTQEFDDAKSHYFKVSREGIKELSKKEYVSQGGYRKW